jgi:hypothetical protein
VQPSEAALEDEDGKDGGEDDAGSRHHLVDGS